MRSPFFCLIHVVIPFADARLAHIQSEAISSKGSCEPLGNMFRYLSTLTFRYCEASHVSHQI
jgi:hypothetical protein